MGISFGFHTAHLTAGKLLNHDYAIIAKVQNIEETQMQLTDDFSIEKARLRTVFYPTILRILAIIGYGWALDKRIVSQLQAAMPIYPI